MIKYIAVLDSDEITLGIMGRKKVFENNTEYDECIYIKTYSQYFKRIGNTIGYSSFLAKPIFIADPIAEFNQKESVRKTEPEYKPEPTSSDLKLVEIDELQDAAEEFIEEKLQRELTQDEVTLLDDTIEDLVEAEVKFETEE